MQNFKELKIWQKSMELVVMVYRETANFPGEEKYGLTTQMRRCAVSIPSNISEGHMRTTNKVFKQFIGVARGSCSELETQNMIAFKLGFLSQEKYQDLENKIIELSKMLTVFNSKLQ